MTTDTALTTTHETRPAVAGNGEAHAAITGEVAANAALGHSLIEALTTIVKQISPDDVTVTVGEPSPIDGKRSFSLRAYRHRRLRE